MLGLGDLYKKENISQALHSIFKYNWKSEMWNHPGILRVYALNGESGLLICTWPKGERPGHAFFFADEVWCGIEYQVASHMIYEGMMDEGLQIVKGVRDRHKGDRRNPWDEFECGHHYVRSMASYALLLALSGFEYSAPEKHLSFTPRIFEDRFRTFFSTATGWGVFSQDAEDTGKVLTIDVKYGSLSLEKMDIPRFELRNKEIKITLDGQEIKSRLTEKMNRLQIEMDPIQMRQGQMMTISVR
jgi:hypothetical protein